MMSSRPRQNDPNQSGHSLLVLSPVVFQDVHLIVIHYADMQSRFKKLSCTAVGGADAERFSIGAEEVTYEGPLQLRLQARFCQRGSRPGLETRSSAD